MKLVSIVVATYKREIELKKALESLAKQTYPYIEIVLVDDNGNDEWNRKVLKIVYQYFRRKEKSFTQLLIRLAV